MNSADHLLAGQVSFKTYGGTATENYQKYFVPTIGAPLAGDLIDVAALRPGERVLDVACGTGVVARHTAQHVGAGGTIAAIDIDPAMLVVARATMPPGVAIEWREASADQLPFPDDSFDVVLCSLGLQFFMDKAASLREMRRVLVHGGRLVINEPSPTPILANMEAAFSRHGSPDAAVYVRRVFSLHDSGEIQRLISEAGFRSIDVEDCMKTLRFSGPGDFPWQYIYSTPLAGAAIQLGKKQGAALERDNDRGQQPSTADGGADVQLSVTVANARK